MNNIEELIGIVIALRGKASTDAIVREYCRTYHMVQLPGYKSTVLLTIKNNPGRLIENSEDHEWIVKPKRSEDNDLSYDGMLMGSPEWFELKSHEQDVINNQAKNDAARKKFIERFAPNELAAMNENELLNRLFRIDEGMLWELTMDNEVYRHFGAAGKYPYLWPLRYNANNDTYVMYSKNKGTDINRKEAESRAHEIRDEILFLVNIVDTIKTFDSIIDYETLEKRTARVSFAKFAWSLKYLQMIYPEVLPQMYADHTIDRALKILGLKKHSNNRIINMGEIALFTAECGIKNDSFGEIYGKYWGWEGDPGPSIYAKSINR